MSQPLSDPLTEHEFMNRIVAEIRSGYGLVPFIGSGVSASSGILMGQEFDQYLAWVVFRCVAERETQGGHERLDLRRQGWPQMPKSEDELTAAANWINTEFESLCEKKYQMNFKAAVQGALKFEEANSGQAELLISWIQRPLIPRVLRNSSTITDEKLKSFWQMVGSDEQKRGWCMQPQDSPTSYEHIKEAALRSLHDWRATLYFLARLKLVRLPKEYLLLEDIDQSTIDKFNIHITHGRRPNLCHNMLCHLAGPARIRTFLTTNFDTLIEDSLRGFRMEYKVIPVVLKDDLPHPDTVHSLNCVIKMHGELTGTRADYSLDDPPTQEDRDRFYHVVCGHHPNNAAQPEAGFIPSHLIVVGYSGADVRCVQMIKYILDLNPHTQVFWLCYSKTDFENLRQRIFREPEYHEKITEKGEKIEGRIHPVVTNRPDLLFYQLYQRLRFSLPGGGFSYQYAPNVPPGSIFLCEKDPSDPIKAPDDATAKIAIQFDILRNKARAGGSGALLVVDSESGVSEPLGHAFHLLLTGSQINGKSIKAVRHGMWLELEDYLNVPHLAHEIMQVVSLRLGRFQLDHSSLMAFEPGDPPDWFVRWKEHAKLLEINWGTAFNDWLVVLYCRNGPGGCVGWDQSYWCSRECLTDDSATKLPSLEEFAAVLSGLGFQVIYAPYSRKRLERDWQREKDLEQKLREHPYIFAPGQDSIKYCPEEKPVNYTVDEHRVTKGPLSSPLDPISPPQSRLQFYDTKILQTKDNYLELRSSEPKFREIIGNMIKDWIRSTPFAAEFDNTPQAHFAALRFLYGCTLFRQSRHFAAFFTDAVFPCPERFNTKGLDNDWIRDKRLQVALKILNQKGLFHLKSGCFLWMHRDIRLGVRYVLEQVKSEHLCISDKSSSRKGLLRLRQVRAADHYAIGDWYSKAYHATGQALAVLEALYHFANCARFSPEAARLSEDLKNEKLVVDRIEYRQGLWKIGLYRLMKNLRFGRSGIRFWLEQGVLRSWFELSPLGQEPSLYSYPGAYELMNTLKTAAIVIDQQVEDAINAFCENKEVQEKLEEVRGKTVELWERHKRQLEHELMACIYAGDNRGIFAAPKLATTALRANETSTQLSGDDGHSSGAYELLARIGKRFRFVKADKQWLEHLLGDLENVCDGKLAQFGYQVSPSAITGLKELLETLFKGEAVSSGPTSDDALHDTVRGWQFKRTMEGGWISSHFLELMCGLTYDWIRRAKVRDHATKTGFSTLATSASRDRLFWAQACAIARLTLDLTPHLEPDFLDDEARIRIQATTLYGLALGRLLRFFESHRRLNEAKALLTKTSGEDDPLSFAIVELRRAEVLLIESQLLHEIACSLEAWEELLSGLDKGHAEHRLEAVRLFEMRGSANLLEPDKFLDLKRLKEEPVEDYEKRLAMVRSKFNADIPNDPLLRSRVYWMQVYLQKPARVEPTWLKEDGSLTCRRLHWARLDEAHLALEGAERMLSGRSHSPLWWSRLHALQLRVYAEHRFILPTTGIQHVQRILALRHQHSHSNHVVEIFRRGLAAAPRDRYRFVRLLDYFLPAFLHAIAADELQRNPHPEKGRINKIFEDRINGLLCGIAKKWAVTNTRWFEGGSSKPEDALLEEYRILVWKKYEGIWPAVF